MFALVLALLIIIGWVIGDWVSADLERREWERHVADDAYRRRLAKGHDPRV